MSSKYFQRLTDETSTRFWINTASSEELNLALVVGAISGTTNPAYCPKLLKSDPGSIYNITGQGVKDIDDDDEAAEVVYQQVTVRFLEKFHPLYERNGGQLRFVTIQWTAPPNMIQFV